MVWAKLPASRDVGQGCTSPPPPGCSWTRPSPSPTPSSCPPTLPSCLTTSMHSFTAEASSTFQQTISSGWESFCWDKVDDITVSAPPSHWVVLRLDLDCGSRCHWIWMRPDDGGGSSGCAQDGLWRETARGGSYYPADPTRPIASTQSAPSDPLLCFTLHKCTLHYNALVHGGDVYQTMHTR